MSAMTPEKMRAEAARLEKLLRSEDKAMWDVANVSSAYAMSVLELPVLLNRIAELERDAGRYRAMRATFPTEELAQNWERTVEVLVKDAAMQERTDNLSSTQTKEPEPDCPHSAFDNCDCFSKPQTKEGVK